MSDPLRLDEAQNRVARGIWKITDHFDSLSWVDEVHLDILDMDQTCACVLAHVFGHYLDGRDALGLDHEELVAYGFDADTTNPADYVTLRTAWEQSLGIIRNARTKETV